MFNRLGSNMNHTNITLVITGLAVSMIAAATIITFASDTAQLAFAKRAMSVKAGGSLKDAVKAGHSESKCDQEQLNGQVVAFGAGAVGNTATNTATGNVQAQNCNAGNSASSASTNSDESAGVWNSGLSTSDK